MENQDAAPPEVTASILLFNVSCGSGGKYAREYKLQEGIEDILKQLEDSIRDTFFLALVNDKVSNPKSRKFENAHLARRRSSPAGSEDVDIFMNKEAEDFLNLPASKKFDDRVLQAQQEGAAITELNEALKNLQLLQDRISLESYFETGGNHPLQAVQEQVKVANSIMEQSSSTLKTFFQNELAFRNFLDRMHIYVSRTISNIRLLVVSWHGPNNDYPEEEKRKTIFTKLVRLVERLKKDVKADVAMIGGDFNLPKKAARLAIDGLAEEHELPPATICDLKRVVEDRDETEDFLVAWSDRCRISIEGRQITAEVEGNGEGQLWPFDHPTLLHTVTLTKYDHLH